VHVVCVPFRVYPDNGANVNNFFYDTMYALLKINSGIFSTFVIANNHAMSLWYVYLFISSSDLAVGDEEE
jgi:hypothetical protein